MTEKNEMTSKVAIPMARPGQRLVEHLRQVAELAGAYGEKNHAARSANVAGLLHDYAKAAPEWQHYLATGQGRPHHAPESATLCMQLFGDAGVPLAYAIKAHHTRLPDWNGDLDNLRQQDQTGLLLELDIHDLLADTDRTRRELICEIGCCASSTESFQLWIRMLASALVDADRLDAEAAESPDRAGIRGDYDAWGVLDQRFALYMEHLRRNARPGPVNTIRQEIFNEVAARSDGKPGFYTLSAPTGGGKTLCAMAFALRHRRVNSQTRIIMSIPYNAIIEQTAKVYKKIFGTRNVLEHHSNFDPGDNPAYQAAVENWDAPIIVTTNVQFFESLLKSGASGLRKIHNIANSIIILDEAQMLPGEHLLPLLATLRALVKDFGCTVVLCSATIPALEKGIIRSDGSTIEGLPAAIPLVAASDAPARNLRRTIVRNLGRLSLDDVGSRISADGPVLCIVNTRRTCRRLYDMVNAPCKIHLSGAMCPAEREKLLSHIRKLLDKSAPLVVVATSLVEAGVDLDFKTVYRELAGIDSIAQAAGRCNREGRQDRPGNVYTFDLGGLPPPSLRAGCNAAAELLPDHGELEMSPELYQRYFKLYYSMIPQFDGAHFAAHFGRVFDFDAFSKDFNMIDNSYQAPLVVLYGHAANLVEELSAAGKPTRRLLRKLQQYTVNVPVKQLDGWRAAALVKTVAGIDVQSYPGLYRPETGLDMPDNGELYSY